MKGLIPSSSKVMLLLSLFFFTTPVFSQTTSWIGSVDNRWRTAANWTSGVPDESTDAIIGDANFAGPNQPTLRRRSGRGSCNSLTIGGVSAIELTILDGMDVFGTVTIASNGVLNDNGGRLTILGDWFNSGSYVASGANRRVYFEGTNQTIGGTSVTNFERFYVNSGTMVNLAQNFIISNFIDLSGTINPETFTITGSGDIDVNAGGTLLVKASTFVGNFAHSGGVSLESGSSVVNYASSVINQTVDNTITYRTLQISGGMTKSLGGNTIIQNDLEILGGTLDLLGFTANRSSNGGNLTLAASTSLIIGGTNTFPINYSTHVLAPTSTVEYNGGNQTVSGEPYGNLTLSSSSGSVIKTMPSSTLNIAGNLTTTVSGGSLDFTADNSIAISGNINLSASSTFNGSTFSHSTSGGWVNEGTYNGCGGTFSFNGTGTSISGGGSFNFGNVIVNGNGTTLDQNTSTSLCGNFSTNGGGTFNHSPGGTGQFTMTGASTLISGSNIQFNNLITAGASSVSTTSTFGIASDLTANGAFTASSGTILFTGSAATIGGSAAVQLAGLTVTGVLSVARNFSISSNLSVLGSLTASTGTVTFNGTSSLSGTANLNDVLITTSASVIMGSGSTLGIANTVTIDGGGTFNPTSNTPNTVNYNGTGAQSLGLAIYDNLTVSGGNIKTPSLGLTINGNLTIDTGTTFNGSSLTHQVAGNWVNGGTFTANTSTIELIGTDDTSISGTTTFNNLTVNKSSTREVILSDDIVVDNLTMISGGMLTESNVLTITATRTGNGIILGTITRTHAFTTATEYAFEGPNNFINFATITGTITSITVVVTSGPNLTFPGAASINRTYEVDVAGGISYSATLRLHYEQSEINGNIESAITIWNDGGIGVWVDLAKTANDVTDNWIEHNSLTNLADKLTLSEGLIKYSWVGTVDEAWENMNNWDPNTGIPTIADVAYLGDEVFTNQPTITTTEQVKKLYFESLTPTTLTLSTGGELTVQGNIDGLWSTDATHTIDVGAQTLTTLSDIVLSQGITNRNIDLIASTGVINIDGSLTQTGDADITFSGAATLNIDGDFNYVSGTFTPASSSVNFSGNGLQHFGGIAFNDLNIAKPTGLAILNASTTVNGDMTLSSSTELDIESTLSVLGDINIGSGTLLDVLASNIINVGGNWNRTGDFNPGAGNVIFNGTGAQSVDPSTFNTFTLSKPSGTLTLLGDITINSDIDILNGTVEVSTFDVTRSTTGGTATMAAGTTARFGGTGLQIINFSTLIAAPTSTIEYYSTSPRIIAPITYGNLTISGGASSAKTMVGPTTIQGNLTVEAGSTLSAASTTLTLEGDFTMNGDFNASGGTVVLNGSGVVNGDVTYNDMVVNGSYDFLSGSITFDGDLIVTSGGDFDAGTLDIISNGDFTNSGIVESDGVVTFLGTQTQTIRLLSAITSSSTGVINFNGSVAPVLSSTTSPQYANLNINNTAPIVPSQPWTVFFSMNIASGSTWDAGLLTHTIYGDFDNAGTVNSSGKLLFTPLATVNVNLGTNFTTSGEIEFGGTGHINLTDDNPVFENVIISNTNAAGITPLTPWTINQDILISAGALLNGASASHVVSGQWTNNGTFNGQTSTITFDSSTGTDAMVGTGSNNFNNLILDTGTILEIAVNLSISSNFTNNATTLNILDETIKFEGTGLSILNGTTVTVFDDLEIDKSATNLQMDTDATVSGTLILTNGALDLNGNELSLTNVDPTAVERTNGYVLSENTSFNSILSWSIGTDLSSFEFPFGTPSGDYIPFLFDLNSGDAGIVSVATYLTGNDNLPLPPGVSNINNAGSDNSDNLVDRFFSINLAGETTPNVDITFNASSAEVGTVTGLLAQRWNSVWEDPLPSQVAGASSVMVPGVTSFSPWAISGNSTPLPVEMTHFSANHSFDKILVLWETASELNNDYFELQKSSNGEDFYPLSKIAGSGTSNQKNSYTYRDRKFTSERQYYRLKQVDFDGSEKLSEVISVHPNSETLTWDVYPNPATDLIHISSSEANEHELRLILYNATGKILIDQTISGSQTNNTLDLDVKKLPSGMYLLKLSSVIDQRTLRLAISK